MLSFELGEELRKMFFVLSWTWDKEKFWVPLRNRTSELRIFHKSFKLQTWIKIISSGWQSFSSEFCCFAIWLEIVKYSALLSNYIHTNMISKHRLQVVSLHGFTSSGKVCYERCLNTFKGVTVSNGATTSALLLTLDIAPPPD